MLMVVFSPLAIDIFLPALPLMAKDLSSTMTLMQWSVTAFLLCMGIGQLISGPLSDRFGRRPIAIAGVVIYGVSAFGLALVNTLDAFLLLRMTQGFGACAIVVSAFASVRDRYDPVQSGVMYSYLSSVICCVPALAPLLGGLLTEHFGWRSNFDVMALYAIAAGTAVVFLLPETRPDHTVVENKLISVSRFKPIITHPVFAFNAMVITLTMAIILSFVTSSPGWIMVHLNQSQDTFVFWFSLNAGLNIVAYLLAPKILVAWGVRKTVGLGMVLLVASGVLMLGLIDWMDSAGFMLPVMVSSLGISLLMGVCSGQALAPFGRNAGSASALMGFLQMSGASVLVSLLQLSPLSAPVQFSLLALTFIPIYMWWKRPKGKAILYPACVK